PTFIPGLNISVDYFDIKVDKFIAGIGATLILNNCVNTANPFFCSLVHRSTNPNALGTLFLSNDGFVQDTTLNTGSLKTTGVDISASYRTDLSNIGLGDHGSISTSFIGTYLDTLVTQPLPGGPSFDCKGLYGVSCGTPNPEWRHKARITWNTPFSYGDWVKSVNVSAQWRYFAKVTADSYDANAQLNNVGAQFANEKTFASQSYLDLSANFTVHNNLNFRVGVNNVLDRDPPLAGANLPGTVGNGNTFPQVYDALGRYMYVGLSADF
ncbi:TonB-dependent receptor domain-containing protein, partial [Phenylobacterium sp.]|uniref:TonB-dependent receptor domain-containing protein n=1 Tax=Phenylobacterium sp. TaxID=1871053 RepID=UPI00374DF9AB